MSSVNYTKYPQKKLFSHLRISVCDSLFVGAARVGLSCRLPGCRELKRTSSASAKWQSIFLFSIVVAGPVGELHILNSSWSGDGFIGNGPYTCICGLNLECY